MLKRVINNILKNKFLLFGLVILFAVFVESVVFNGYEIFKARKNLGRYTITDINTSIKKEKEKVEFEEKKTIYDNDEINKDNKETKYQEIEKNTRVITINFEKKYVKRIRVKYKTNSQRSSNAVNFIELFTFDIYGNPSVEIDYTQFPYGMNTLVKNIDKRVDKIKINISSDYDDISIDSVEVVNTFSFNWIRFICILLVCISLTIIYLLRKSLSKKLELFFVIISLCVGLMLIIVIPSTTSISWDDKTHFNTAYTMFDDNICYTDSYYYATMNRGLTWSIPESYEEHLLLNEYLNSNNKCNKNDEFKNQNSVISISDYAYVPSGLVIKLCKVLNVPFSLMFKLGKLITLLIYTFVGYITIKNAKIGKKLLFVILLLPTNLFLATQYSKDAYITPFLALGVSTFINICVANDKVNLKSIMIMVLSILFASGAKMVYIPLLLLLLFIPKNKFKNNKQSLLVKTIIILLLLICMKVFLLPNISVGGSINYDINGVNRSSGGQVANILEQPVSFARVFVSAFVSFTSTYFVRVEALANFHSYKVLTPAIYYLLLFVFLFVIFTGENSKYKIPTKIKLILLILSTLIICFIMGSMYLYYSSVGSITVDGVQPRYFLPLFYPVLLLFNNSIVKVKISENKYNIILILSLMFISIYYIFDNILIPFAS